MHTKNAYTIVDCKDKGRQMPESHIYFCIENLPERYPSSLRCSGDPHGIRYGIKGKFPDTKPKIVVKAGICSSVFLIRMARCYQENLRHVCSLPEDAPFHLPCTNSMGFSQIQSMVVGRGGDCRR